MKTLAVVVLIGFFGVGSIQAAPKGTLEYRYWTGFYGATVLELRLEDTVWGMRLWSAHGYDEDHCASIGQCFEDSFAGADVTYRLSPTSHLYLGWQHLYRTMEWAGHFYFTSHQGFRLGVMGTVPLSGKLSGVYDVHFVPTNLWRDSWMTGVGTGGAYRLGLQYELSATSYAEIGAWSIGFNVPGMKTYDFNGHRWNGTYIGFGMRF